MSGLCCRALRVPGVARSTTVRHHFIEYRSSVALAACGVLIASILVVVGPGLGGDGTGPARAVAADIESRLKGLALSVEGRAHRLAQSPDFVRVIHDLDQPARALTPMDLGFRPQQDEWIALSRIDAGSHREDALWQTPALPGPLVPLGTYVRLTTGGLWVVTAIDVEANRQPALARVRLRVGRRIDFEAPSRALARAGISARVVARSVATTIVAAPTSAGGAEAMISIDPMSGLFLAARLPMRRWPWIELGLLVAGVWTAAGVLAARRIEMGHPSTAPAPTKSAVRDGRARASNVELALLFDEFLDMRNRCGDVGGGPSFEEFARSLQRQRATMMAGGGPRAVSFYVAFVDGHAVVRARSAG